MLWTKKPYFSNYRKLMSTRPQKDPAKKANGDYTATLEQIGSQIESVQDFWRYNNNTPVEQIKMRESIYLFKQGFQPIWEDRRNINGGSWTFRVPKAIGPDFWTRVQIMAIGEKLQGCLELGTCQSFWIMHRNLILKQVISYVVLDFLSGLTLIWSVSGTVMPPSRNPLMPYLQQCLKNYQQNWSLSQTTTSTRSIPTTQASRRHQLRLR